jgi:hypothetical protein
LGVTVISAKARQKMVRCNTCHYRDDLAHVNTILLRCVNNVLISQIIGFQVSFKEALP